MSDTKLISKEEVLALTEKGLEALRVQEAEAISILNKMISEAAQQGRSDVAIVGKLHSHSSGPVMYNNKLLLNDRLDKELRANGFTINYPHIGGKSDVTLLISWK